MRDITIIILLLIAGFLVNAQEPYQELTKQETRQFLQTVERNLASIRTLACRFRQVKHLQLFADAMKMKGCCYIEKPDGIRWEYFAPLRKTIILQNRSLHVFKTADSRQAEKVNVGNSQYLKTVYGQIILFFQGRFQTETSQFTLSVGRGHEDYLLRCIPQQELQKFVKRIEIKIAANHRDITAVIIYEPRGDHTVIHFYSFVYNPVFHARLFRQKTLGKFEEGFSAYR